MTIVSQIQEYFPSKVRSDATGTHDDGNDLNERTPEPVRDQLVEVVDPDLPAHGSGRLSNELAGTERAPEPPVHIMVRTRNQSGERELLASVQQENNKDQWRFLIRVSSSGGRCMDYAAPVTCDEVSPEHIRRIESIL